jgi:hypothetical protein
MQFDVFQEEAAALMDCPEASEEGTPKPWTLHPELGTSRRLALNPVWTLMLMVMGMAA